MNAQTAMRYMSHTGRNEVVSDDGVKWRKSLNAFGGYVRGDGQCRARVPEGEYEAIDPVCWVCAAGSARVAPNGTVYCDGCKP